MVVGKFPQPEDEESELSKSKKIESLKPQKQPSLAASSQRSGALAAIFRDSSNKFSITASEIEEPKSEFNQSAAITLTAKIEAVADKRGPTFKCVGCMESFDLLALAKISCRHRYCRDCLQALFALAFKDEGAYPPKCCRSIIERDTVKEFLTPEIEATFASKKIEYASSNRTYCSDYKCATFIPPSHISGNQATCPNCSNVTCSKCKYVWHSSLVDCHADVGLEQILQLADRLGWQRCAKCQAIVSIKDG
jgi:hypothetical protein